MLCIGIRNVTLKNGEPRAIVSAIGRRFSDDSLYVDQVWLSVKEANKVYPGCYFRAFKDGGVFVEEKPPFDVSVFDEL